MDLTGTTADGQLEIADRVNAVMQQGFELKPELLKPEAKLFEELGLDSLDAIDLVVHLEEKLGIKVEAERFQNVRTLSDVYTLVGALVAEAKADASAKTNA